MNQADIWRWKQIVEGSKEFSLLADVDLLGLHWFAGCLEIHRMN